MKASKILWSQVLLVGAVALAFVWSETEWAAWRLAFQPQLGHSWFRLLGWPVYQPMAFFWRWFAYDAHARDIFVEGAYIAASGGCAIARFLIKGAPEQSVNQLSGGNQQKVVIAKSILREPKVVILDEPTRGIDVGARAAIYEIVVELAKEGMAVIVVSSDLDEVLGLAHRVMVLSRGRNRGILDRDAAGRVSIMELATT